jgi:hypothetical protein
MTHYEFHSVSGVRINKSRGVWLARYLAYVGQRVNMYKILVENAEANKRFVKYHIEKM